MKHGSKANLASLALAAALITQFSGRSRSVSSNTAPPSNLASGQGVVAQLPLPTKTGQVFVLDDFENKVTQSDLGFNYFAGNGGAVGSGLCRWSPESAGTGVGSLRLAYNFNGGTPFARCFFSVFGLTDTLVSLDGSGQQPSTST